MSVHFSKQGNTIVVFGNTFPIKEAIKSLGGRFNGADKIWAISYSEDRLTEIRKLCERVGGGEFLPAGMGPAEEAGQGVQGVPDVLIKEVSVTTSVEVTETAKLAVKDDFKKDDAKKDDVKTFTVKEVVDLASTAIQNAFSTPLWVAGEIENVAVRPSGIYFNLATAKSEANQVAALTLRGVIWQSTVTMLKLKYGIDIVKEILADGIQARLLCQVSLYKDRGALSLTIYDIDVSYTKGVLALAREELLKKLAKDGLVDANKKLALTQFPFRVGLISAEDSRAKNDFVDQLFSIGFPGEVIFCPATMQGEQCPAAVSGALQALSNYNCDLIVITRGGGSTSDLRWFDAEQIAYAIACCNVPVIAAIGHHEDTCVAEMIAHMRQKTPTAAADFVVSIFTETSSRIEEIIQELRRALDRQMREQQNLHMFLKEKLVSSSQQFLNRHDNHLNSLTHDLKLRGMSFVADQTRVLDRSTNLLHQSGLQKINSETLKLEKLQSKITCHDPKPWLINGWTRLEINKKVIRSAKAANVGDKGCLRLVDGKFEVEIKGVLP